MKKLIPSLTIGIILMVVFIASGALYVVNEENQVIITQFGKPVGKPVTKAGLYFKVPFIQQTNYFEKRIMIWDGYPNQIPTQDKRYIWVDTTARWRIVDPLKFLQSVYNESGAHARLDDIVDSATRDAITSAPLIEVVRTSNRVLQTLKEQEDVMLPEEADLAEEIKIGRDELTRTVLARASEIVPQYGIELLDVRIKRIDYVEEVRKRVYDRMISERNRVAEKYRSEGEGRKAEIEGEKDKEKQRLISQAYRNAQEIKGRADAEVTAIYAAAYNNDPEFYSFMKTLETYSSTVDENSTVILTTDSDFYEYFKNIRKK